MAIPEGYTFLAKLGIAYKGDYSEAETYEKFNAVYYNGSTFIALVDNPDGPPIADGANWQYMAQGFLSQVISSLTATDKNGVIGEAGKTVNAQELIDGMSDDLKDKLDKTGDTSNTTATFEQAESRMNIITGEKESTFRGKIKKWFADMTVAAFSQIISSNTDLMANTVAGYLVDALAVKQQFDVVNSNLSDLSLASIKTFDELITNMNDFASRTSIAFFNPSTLNTPVSNTYGVCLCFGSIAVDWYSQICSLTNTSDVYSRNYSNGVWSEWVRLS